MLVVPAGSELEFLHPLPVEALWGVGKVTASRLHRLGVSTIAELAEASTAMMTPHLGKAAAANLGALVWNIDPRRVLGGRRAGSVGSQQALGRGLTDYGDMSVVVLGLADRIGRRLRAKGRTGSTLTLRARYPGPRSVTRSLTLRYPTASTAALSELGKGLLMRALEDRQDEPVTLIGLSVSHLTTDTHVQLELDLGDTAVGRAGSAADLRRRSLDEMVDQVRDRFGRQKLRIGETGTNDDDFRRLAERS
jgi:DNA polymerase-4